MYICQTCQKEVVVNHINPPVKTCECSGGVVAQISGTASGVGGLNVTEEPNHNLSDNSVVIMRSAMTAIIAVEFFSENKSKLFAKNIKVEDSDTGRKFEFTITANEI